MCGSMADIQSGTAEIRRGKKKKEEETTGQKYNGLSYSKLAGIPQTGGSVAEWLRRWTCNPQVASSIPSRDAVE